MGQTNETTPLATGRGVGGEAPKKLSIIAFSGDFDKLTAVFTLGTGAAAVGYEMSVRPTFALYNTREDVDKLVIAVRKIVGSRQR